MSTLTLTLEGLDELQAKIAAMGNDLQTAVGDAAHTWCTDVMEVSQQRVPIRSGELAGSGYVDPPEVSGGTVSVEMGYRASYAVYVHEALEGAQAPSPRWSWTKHVERGKAIDFRRAGSGPKYLEGPADEMENELSDRIAQAALEVMG